MRFKPSREFYVPKGARKVSHKASSAVAYVYETGKGALCGLGFQGKAQKPSWRFRFANEAQRTGYVQRFFAEVEASETAKAQREEAKKAARAKGHGWEVGLILSSSWGYEQTNVDFYEVTALIGGTMVEIEKIGTQRATDSADGLHAMSETVVPDLEHRSGEKSRHRVAEGSLRLKSYAHASPWHGRPLYCSWYA